MQARHDAATLALPSAAALTFAVILAATLAAACGDEADPPQTGTDAGVDTGVDAEVGVDQGEDTPTGGPRWRRPAGMASVRFSADDRANRTYGDADLTLVGNFTYDPGSNVITITDWTPPGDGAGVPLYDDGPYTEGGHEGVDSTAGDHVFGCEIFIDNALFRDIEFGVLGADGEWIWDGAPDEVTVVAGETGTVALPGLTIAPFGDIDVDAMLDTTLLHEQFAAAGAAATQVRVRSSGISWREVVLADDGTAGDAAAGDGIFTFRLSSHLGAHDGLLRRGDEMQFVFAFGTAEGDAYRLDGDSLTDGVSAWSTWEGPGTQVFSAEELLLRSEVLGDRLNTALIVGPDDDLPGGDDPSITGISPNQGPTSGGTPVLVRGTDFERGAQVYFDDVLADCQVQGDELITCLTPARDGGARVPVRVENPGGGSDTNALGFAYRAGLIVVDSVDPGAGPLAGGTEVTITGAGFSDGDAVFFGVSAATSVTWVDEGTLRAVSPTGDAGAVEVRVVGDDDEAALAGAFSYRPTGVDWGRLATASPVMAASGSELAPLGVWIYEAEVTDAPGFDGDELSVDLLYAPAGSRDPSEDDEDWQVAAMAPAGRWGDLALYESAPLSLAAGDYLWIVRAAPAEAEPADVRWIGSAGIADAYASATAAAARVASGLVLTSVTPPRVPVVDSDGDARITLAGAGFSADTEVEVRPTGGGDDAWVSAAAALEAGALVVTLPTAAAGAPRQLGGWDLRLDGDDALVFDAAFTASNLGSPTVDGVLGGAEWPAAWLVAESDELADWDLNHLDALYLAYDESGLYLAVEGGLERQGGEEDPGDALAVYLDLDFGSGSGFAAMRALADEDPDRPADWWSLDRALTSDLDATAVAGFGADWAFGTMEIVPSERTDYLDELTGWRRLVAGDLEWQGIENAEGAECSYAATCGDDAVTCVAGDGDDEGGTVETFLPWCLVSDLGLPPGGLTLALVARLLNRTGTATSQQVLPPAAGGCVGFGCFVAEDAVTLPVR